MIDHFLSALKRLPERQRNSPGIVAISGGPDSVALAHLARLLPNPIILAHLNHQLRGNESDADEAFVRDLAANWNVPCETTRIDVAQKARGHNLEQTARDIRYRWLTEIARQHQAGWIATGHTADDQAETVLHHFLRGTGLRGLSGIAEQLPLTTEVTLIRPLLQVRRMDLLTLLGDNSVAYRVDSSNFDPRLTRSRLRHEIIPLLQRDINPALVEVLARFAIQADECQTAVTAIAQEWLARAEKPRVGDLLVFDRDLLQSADPFWVREMFRLVWKREKWPMGEMNADDWRRLNSLVAGSPPRHDFPGRIHVRVQRHVIRLESGERPRLGSWDDDESGP